MRETGANNGTICLHEVVTVQGFPIRGAKLLAALMVDIEISVYFMDERCVSR